MSDLKAWQRIAVLGLNNHSGEFPVSEQVAAVYPNNPDTDPVRRFLDLAVLSHDSIQFASLPEKEDFDELPPLLDESTATIPDHLARQFEAIRNGFVLQGLLFALYQKNLHLPERWVQHYLNACRNDKGLPAMLRMVISEKLRWLAKLNPEWHKLLVEEDKPADFPLPLQLAWLSRQPKENLLEILKEYWFGVVPSEAMHWIGYYHDLSKEELQTLAELTCKERSRKTRRVISRLLAANNVEDLQKQATELLRHHLKAKSKLLRDGVEILPPEELTAELKALNINEYDYTGHYLPKPVLRLGQLMVLAGVEGIASCLDKPVAQSYKLLAASDFSKELSTFLLEAALWSKDTEAVGIWCQSYKGKKQPDLEWENLLAGMDRERVRCLIATMLEHKNMLWLDNEFFKYLYAHNLTLDRQASEAFVTYMKAELKHGFYNGQSLLIKMLCLLAPDVLESLQKILAESTVNFANEMATVLRFRLALEKP